MRAWRRIVLVSAFNVALSSPTHAQSACPAGAPRDASLTCQQQYYAGVDRLMADAYKGAMARAEASGLGKNLIMDWKRALQEAQRKWLAFREADCGPPVAYETTVKATARDDAQLACRIRHTEARLAALVARYR